MELGIVEWFKKYNNKLTTIEEWIEKFNEEMPAKDVYLEVCIAGDEYMGKDGKIRKTLFFAKSEQVNDVWHNPYKGLLNTKKKVVTYSEAKHFKRVTPTEVDGFKPEDVSIDMPSSDSLIDINIEGFDL